MIEWLKKQILKKPINTIISVIVLFFVFKICFEIIDWLFIKSVLSGTANDCRQSSGACLVFIRVKMRFILFGTYPYEYHWRPILCIILFITSIITIMLKPKVLLARSILFLFFCNFCLIFIIMRGGVLGLEYVAFEKWGGLPLTLILSFFGVIFSYPLGILLALGRNSSLVFIKSFCIFYIELIRGVPLISVLFIFSVLFPLFLPEGIELENKTLRAQLAIIFFMSAYMAEVVRGGLASIPKGQYEAAYSLGLNSVQTNLYIILPQALKIVVAPTVNTAIGLFKDTSLVFILSLFDLLGTAKAALKDPNWQGFSMESYLFVALIYFIFCFSFSRYSKTLERS